MKFNKQIVIILVLISLLLSSLGGGYYYYKQNQKSLKISNQVRTVFVAAKDIKKNTKITIKDLKQINIAKKYILSTPLLKKEIIGKFAKENIYKNDMFRKEKLVKTIQEDTKQKDKDLYKYNSYNMAYSMFQNPNYSVKKDEVINIISVYPLDKKKDNASPNSVQYVAKQIRIIGFLMDSKEVDKSMKKEKVTTTVKKKKVTKTITKKAEELLLDIDGKVLLRLIDDYNRGNQLWMVKTHKVKQEEIINQKIKKEPVAKEVIKKKIASKSTNCKKVKKHKTYKKYKRIYPVILYKPKNSFNSLKATIHYADNKSAAVIKNKVVKVDLVKKCTNTHNYVIGITNNIHLRRGSSTSHKIIRVVHKNYIIPYSGITDNSWYLTCDGMYVHRSEVKVINKDLVKRKLVN